MKINQTLFFFFLLCSISLNAQDKDTIPKSWNLNLGVGIDAFQLLQINPRVGAGENKLGFGWVTSMSAKYQKKRLTWNHDLSWNFSIQKLGGGIFLNSNAKTPFQKSIDEFRISSKAGYTFRDSSNFFYALDFSFLSQFTHTYDGNFLKDIENSGIKNDPISKFLSPAQLTFSLGIDYKPNSKISIFLSPVSYKSIIVLDDAIADDIVRNDNGEIEGSIHGNSIQVSDDKMELISFSHVQRNFGSLLKVNYANKFLDEKIHFKSILSLYSNYFAEIGNLDFEWTTETEFLIYKGLRISILTTAFYDYDVYAYRTNYDLQGGIETIPHRDLLSFTEQLLIKYNIVF